MGSWDEGLDCGCCWQVLMATGRKPKTQNIGLEDVGAEIDEKGGLKVTTCHPNMCKLISCKYLLHQIY